MKKTLVIGMGLSGRSVALTLLRMQKKVMGVDKSYLMLQNDPQILSLIESGLELVSDTYPVPLQEIDLAIVSPGISPDHLLLKALEQSSIAIMGEAEFAACYLKDKQWLAVSGTNGKTTTTLLIEHILKENKQNCLALGNIGEPFSSYIDRIDDEVMVAELSSYQIERLYTPILDGAVLLNITYDHLDRYPSFLAYAQAKMRMQELLKPTAILYVFEKIQEEFSGLDPAKIRTFGYKPCSYLYSDLESLFILGKKVSELPDSLKGRKSHDLENFMAAFLLTIDRGVLPDLIVKSFISFKKPSHRMERVVTHKGISFIDDSKGTNIDATIRAVESIPGPIFLIAGGVHKGASYKEWIQPFEGRVKAIFAIGQAAHIIKEDLKPSFNVEILSSLEEAVQKSYQIASLGDTILLSPGCSSFDMFKDYKHRGEEFKKSVFNLLK